MAFHISRALGIDISDRTLELFELKKKFSKFEVISYARSELREGVVDNGEVLDSDELAKVIRNLLERAEPKKPKTPNVVLSVPESRTFIHTFQLPSVISEKNVGESIQFMAEETIPLSFDQVYYDYDIVGRTDEHQEVLYVACYKEIVDGYHEVVKQAGLNPVVLEPESLALTRTIVRSGEKEAVLIVDVGARTTNVTVYDHGGIRYSLTLKVGGRTLLKAISEALHVDTKRAEQLLESVGLVHEFKSGEEGTFQTAIDPLIKEIVSSIERAEQSYTKRTGTRIEKIVLSGGVSLTPGFVSHVRTRLGEKVVLSNPLEGIQYSDESLKRVKEPVLYGTAIGLALRGVDAQSIKKGINLKMHEGEHKTMDMSEESVKQHKEMKIKRTLTPSDSKKRLLIMVVVFTILIILFVVVLFMRPEFGDTNTNYDVDYSASSSPVVNSVD